MIVSKFLGDLPKYSIYTVLNKMGLAGCINGEATPRILTPPKYDLIMPFHKGYALVKIDGLWGIIDSMGNETVSPQYRSMWRCPDIESYYASDGRNEGRYISPLGKEMVLDEKSLLIAEDIHRHTGRRPGFVKCTNNSHLFYFSDDRWSNNGYYGIYNSQVHGIIASNYSRVRMINNDKFIITNHSGKKGIIDEYGKQLVPYIYDDLFYCATKEEWVDSNLIEAKKNGKSGYIDFNGIVKIPFIYRNCGTFEKGYAWVSNDNGKVGVIDRYGREVEPLIYDNVLYLRNELPVCIYESSLGERYKIVGKSKEYTKFSINQRYFNFFVLHNHDYVEFETNMRKKGLMCLNGEIIIPAEYDRLNFVQLNECDCIYAQKNGKFGIIGMDNRIRSPFEYDYISSEEITHNGKKSVVFIVHKGSKKGLLTADCKITVPIIYDSIEYNKEYQCFTVRLGEEKGLVDIDNNIIVPFNKFL